MPEPIEFGTDGWRDVIALGFTGEKVLGVAGAIAAWLEEAGDDRPVLIGYDTRFNADKFADIAAQEFASRGVDTVLSGRHCPTPALAWAVEEHSFSGGLMFTSSHNLPEWMGIKFIPSGGAPADTATTDRISELTGEIEISGQRLTEREEREFDGERLDFRDGYLQHLRGLIDLQRIAQMNAHLVLDYQNGAACGWLDSLLGEANVDYRTVRDRPDPTFSGHRPDPTEEMLRTDWNRFDISAGILMGFDGDGDRVGVLEDAATYLTGNELIPLLGHHLITRQDQTGPLARNVATSHLVDRVSEAHGHEVVETKIGFKYLGPALLEGAVVAGEESGGISAREHLPEKDGLYSGLKVLEAAAHAGSFRAAVENLWDEYGESHALREDYEMGPEDTQALFQRIDEYGEGDELLSNSIQRINRRDGYKFIFGETDWACFRASGTEPVVRVYIEAREEGELNRLHREAQQIVRSARRGERRA